ncbi:hypothetical protein H671_1g2919 [Cricetulus griseus]|uniref:Uncharacterized protein n=1 Tax=Cricetulus griseus TaxID=10029 RepID=A0A061ILK2_CRIGR|nr:hypothetical protein H671_1g2919 [Cricetulus griseus]
MSPVEPEVVNFHTELFQCLLKSLTTRRFPLQSTERREDQKQSKISVVFTSHQGSFSWQQIETTTENHNHNLMDTSIKHFSP